MQVIVFIAVVGYLDEIFNDHGSLGGSFALKDFSRHPRCHLKGENSNKDNF